MGTFLELKTEVATAIIDTPARVLALVPSFVKRAIYNLQTDHNFKVMEAQTDHTTLEGIRTLVTAKPSDFKEYRGRPWRLGFQGGINRVNIAVSRAEVLAKIASNAAGSPRFILETLQAAATGGSSFEVYPLPDGNSDYSDGEYRISIPYWKYLAELVADGDTNWFTTNGHEYIVHTASGYGFQYDWDESRMAVWAQTGEALKKRIINRDKRLVLSGVDTLVPHWEGANDPKVQE